MFVKQLCPWTGLAAPTLEPRIFAYIWHTMHENHKDRVQWIQPQWSAHNIFGLLKIEEAEWRFNGYSRPQVKIPPEQISITNFQVMFQDSPGYEWYHPTEHVLIPSKNEEHTELTLQDVMTYEPPKPEKSEAQHKHENYDPAISVVHSVFTDVCGLDAFTAGKWVPEYLDSGEFDFSDVYSQDNVKKAIKWYQQRMKT